MIPDHTSPLSVAYFESLAEEPGKKALCLPLHCGTLGVLEEFICHHWQRGFVIAVKTDEQAERIKQELKDMLSFLRPMHIELLESYQQASESELQNYPIIVTTHTVLCQYPQYFFRYMFDESVNKNLKVRDFVIIIEYPYANYVRLSEAEYHLLNGLTKGTDDIAEAQKYIQEHLESDNVLVQESVYFLLRILLSTYRETSKDITPYTIDRSLYRLGVVIDQREGGMLSRIYHEYIAHLYCGLLRNPYVWVIDGTGDLHFKNSSIWSLHRYPAYAYRLICSQEPVVLDVRMIKRSVRSLSRQGSNPERYGNRFNMWIDNVCLELERISHQHEHILVVLWKDLKGSVDLSEEEDTPLIESDSLSAKENTLVPYFEKKISQRLLEMSDKFIFTSYQSFSPPSYIRAYSKADAVVFIGMFFMNTHALEAWNTLHASSMTQKDHALAEIVERTFHTRCQFGEPVSVYFTRDWTNTRELGQTFIQDFLDYTHAVDTQGQRVYILREETALDRTMKQMKLSPKIQQPLVRKIVAVYPEFEHTWHIDLSQKEAMSILGYDNSRDLKRVLKTLEKKGIKINMV